MGGTPHLDLHPGPSPSFVVNIRCVFLVVETGRVVVTGLIENGQC